MADVAPRGRRPVSRPAVESGIEPATFERFIRLVPAKNDPLVITPLQMKSVDLVDHRSNNGEMRPAGSDILPGQVPSMKLVRQSIVGLVYDGRR